VAGDDVGQHRDILAARVAGNGHFGEDWNRILCAGHSDIPVAAHQRIGLLQQVSGAGHRILTSYSNRANC
jgi:hypothetical protein